jgi:hypothetical protein
MSDAEKIAAWVGVAGFGLALVSLIWQVISFRAERREKVSAELSCVISAGCPSPVMLLKVWNSGRTPVYIEQVELCVGHRTRKVGAGYLSVAFEPYQEGILAGWRVVRPLHETAREESRGLRPLLVGEPMLFRLPKNTIETSMLQKVCEAPRKQVWISISSPEGEILWLKGKQVQPIIRVIKGMPNPVGSVGGPT